VENSINFSKANMLSPDGRCKTFDASANGYVRGEGCGVFFVSTKESEFSVAGFAINQDGRSNGLTAPSAPAQVALIKQAKQSAGVECEVVECHGTGTPLGDPIEMSALFESSTSKKKTQILSSVKTNFGHTEAAAGAASLLKVCYLLFVLFCFFCFFFF
jgi:acyl transferase domain-containing protein